MDPPIALSLHAAPALGLGAAGDHVLNSTAPVPPGSFTAKFSPVIQWGFCLLVIYCMC